MAIHSMRQKKANVSVIIPTFNRRELLARSIQSVMAQSLVPEQIIVVDDGSNDCTKEMLQHNFPNVEYFWQPQAGVSAARNFAIRQSQGEWIALLDSDDEWLPEKLDRQFLQLSQNTHLKISHTDEIWIRRGVRVNQKKKHKKKGGWIFQQCLPLCAMSPSSILIHRSVFDQVGLFDETLPACEDYDLWLRITHQYPVDFVETPLIRKYGGHEDQLSQKFWGMDRFRITALQKILANTPSLSDSDRDAAKKMLIEKARIYSLGARKRGRIEQADLYLALAERYQKYSGENQDEFDEDI